MRRLRQILALLLALTVALGLFFIPNGARLLAAPALQTAAPALKGYYQSDVIPGQGDNPNLVVGLILFDDGSARVVSDYENNTNVINELGTWADNGDNTLTLTVTGTVDSVYAAPVSLNFQVADNGSLVVPGSATGAFGEAGLTLIPTPFGKSEAVLAKMPSDALVYQSRVVTSPSSAGLQLTLALFEDGSLTLVSDYMNKGDNVVEIGKWTQGDDNTLSISLTGQMETGSNQVTAYDTPLQFVFNIHDDNSLALVDEGGALFGPQGLTLFPGAGTGAANKDAQGETVAEAEAVADLASNPSEVVTGTVSAGAGETITGTTAETPTLEATAQATEEPTAEATVEATTVVTPGATADAGKEPAAEATPKPTEEATTEPSAQGTSNGEGVTGTAVMTPTGAYVSSVLPSENKGGSFLVMVFNDDGSLYFTTYSLNGDHPLVEVGTWANKDGDYTATVTGTVDKPYDQPIEVPFTIGKDGAINIADVRLQPIASINSASAPSATTEAPVTETPITETGGAKTVVTQFQSGVISDSAGATQTVGLIFYDDSSAKWTAATQAGEPSTKYGEWKVGESGDAITVTLTRDDQGALAAPEQWIFEIGSNHTIVLKNDDKGVFGDAGLTLTEINTETETTQGGENGGVENNEVVTGTEEGGANASGTEVTATQAITNGAEVSPTAGVSATAGIQIFQSDVLPSASSPGLQLTLGMRDDGSAAIDYDYKNNKDVITNKGNWAENKDGTVTVILTDGPTGKLIQPVKLTLKLSPDGNWLITDASEESLGLVNVVLKPVAAP